MVRFSILIVVFLFYVTSSYAANDVDVQAICKETKDPSFCLTLLKSKPNGVGGDLKSLAQYTLDVLHTNVSNIVTLIKQLIAQSGSDPKKQNFYNLCLGYFGDGGALDLVIVAQKRFKDSNYNEVSVRMVYIEFNVHNCLIGDPSDTSLLPKYGHVVEKVAYTTLVISNMLVDS